MAGDQAQAFLNKHFEKIILVVAGGVFVAAMVLFVGTRTDQTAVRTQVARSLVDIKKGLETADLPSVLSPEERAKLGLDRAPVTAADYDKKVNELPKEPWDAGKDFVGGLVVVSRDEGSIRVPPVVPQILPVTDVVAVAGRGTTSEAVPTAIYKLEGAKVPLSDIVWAGVTGQFDLTAQLDEFVKAHDDPQKIILTRLELLRREQKADGTWTEWKAVAPAVASASAAKWPKTPPNPRDKKAVGQWYLALDAMQGDVRRPPIYRLVAIDEEGQLVRPVTGVEQPDVNRVIHAAAAPPQAPAPEGAPAVGAAPPAAAPPPPPPRPAGGGPSWLDVTAIPATTAAAAPTEETAIKHVYATVSAYDTSVEPGKAYQYQMRVAIFNPIYSVPDVRDDKARWALEFESDWSQPSREVTIPSLVQFYFIGTSGERANLELHRWILGQWVIVRSAQMNLGAPVVYVKRAQELIVPGTSSSDRGGRVRKDVDLSPQVLLVDILRGFPYQPEGTSRPIRASLLVFADAKGELLQRIDWADRDQATKDRLTREGGPVKPPTPTPTPTPRPPKPKPPPKTPTKTR